jgi:hypothetical protein
MGRTPIRLGEKKCGIELGGVTDDIFDPSCENQDVNVEIFYDLVLP